MKLIELNLKRKDEQKYFYSEDCVYCVNYLCNKIFFLNNQILHENGIMVYENNYAEFKLEEINSGNMNDLNLKVLPMPFYRNDHSDCLKDFSLSFSEQKIFLLWGYYTKSLEVNENLLIYEISQKKWKRVIISRYDTSYEVFPRMKASSVCFSDASRLTSIIFVFSGYSQPDQEFRDIYNIVDKIEYNNGDDIASHFRFSKSFYKETYKPLWDSQAIPILSPQNNDPQNFLMLLIGGSFSKFIYNQDNKNLAIYIVKIDSGVISFQNLIKSNAKSSKEGMNLLFATQNKNFYFHNKLNKIAIVLSLFTQEQKGLFLELNEDLQNIKNQSLEQPEDKQIQDIGSKKYNKTRMEKVVEKKKKENFSQKVLYLNIEMEHLTPTKIKTINKLQYQPFAQKNQIIFPRNLFDSEQFFDMLLIEEDVSEIILLKESKSKSKNEDIVRIEFFINKANGSEIRPSKLKSSNYALNNNILYVLINNEKDSECKRLVYSHDIKNIEINVTSKIKLKKEFEENFFPFLEGCSIIAENQKVYVLGGVINKRKFERSQCENEKKTNLSYDLINKRTFFFASNLNQMKNPYLFFSNECLFCINRQIISNPYIELQFFAEYSKELYNQIKDFDGNGHYIYGEIIKKNFEKDQWGIFLINLNLFTPQIIFASYCEKYFKNEQKYNYHQTCISRSFLCLGQIQKDMSEGAGFLYSYQTNPESKNIFIKYLK